MSIQFTPPAISPEIVHEATHSVQAPLLLALAFPLLLQGISLAQTFEYAASPAASEDKLTSFILWATTVLNLAHSGMTIHWAWLAMVNHFADLSYIISIPSVATQRVATVLIIGILCQIFYQLKIYAYMRKKWLWLIFASFNICTLAFGVFNIVKITQAKTFSALPDLKYYFFFEHLLIAIENLIISVLITRMLMQQRSKTNTELQGLNSILTYGITAGYLIPTLNLATAILAIATPTQAFDTIPLFSLGNIASICILACTNSQSLWQASLKSGLSVKSKTSTPAIPQMFQPRAPDTESERTLRHVRSDYELDQSEKISEHGSIRRLTKPT